MRFHLKEFLRDETGAITVDWVVLTAALVGFGVSIVAVIGTAATDKSSGLGAHISSQTTGTY